MINIVCSTFLRYIKFLKVIYSVFRLDQPGCLKQQGVQGFSEDLAIWDQSVWNYWESVESSLKPWSMRPKIFLLSHLGRNRFLLGSVYANVAGPKPEILTVHVPAPQSDYSWNDVEGSINWFIVVFYNNLVLYSSDIACQDLHNERSFTFLAAWKGRPAFTETPISFASLHGLVDAWSVLNWVTRC